MIELHIWMEAARLWSEEQMPQDWDRNDGLYISIFYNHMLKFIADNYNLTSK